MLILSTCLRPLSRLGCITAMPALRVESALISNPQRLELITLSWKRVEESWLSNHGRETQLATQHTNRIHLGRDSSSIHSPTPPLTRLLPHSPPRFSRCSGNQAVALTKKVPSSSTNPSHSARSFAAGYWGAQRLTTLAALLRQWVPPL